MSFGDSPFNGPSFTYFHLETFEDGALNTPGVTSSVGGVLGPAPLTDSVDADDGSIDGSGTAGHSFYSQGSHVFEFTFNALALGGLPTHAGVVWTDVGFSDVPPNGFGLVSFEAFDALGTSLGPLGPSPVGDGQFTGQAAEDRFFGAIDAGGISRILISMNSGDWEIDHLQYGQAVQAVPEPSSLLMACVAGVLVIPYAWRRSGRPRLAKNTRGR